MTLKVLSWNIWHGKYLDKVITFIDEQKPDIIALQEIVESETVVNLAKQIADKLGYNYVYCNAFETDRHTPSYRIGNAILTNYKIASSECHLLSEIDKYKKSPSYETEPRVAVQVSLNIDGKIINIFNTHLAHVHKFKKSEMQKMQVESLIEILTREKTILFGDFNSLPKSPVVKKVESVLTNTDREVAKPTWSYYPEQGCGVLGLKYKIDYIFVSSDIKVQDFEVGDSDGSDHLPISAVLEV